MAFAFDIDGVLVRGHRLIPKGRRALQILNGDNNLGIKIPHIFLTNGGGRLEADRCAQLTQILNTGSPVLANQLIQSHTPMQALKEYYSTVLIVGGEGDRCKRIAQAYGFSDVIVPHDIVAWDATIVPFKKLSPSEVAAANPRDFSSVNINAILVFSSSRDYATDLQIIMDLLRSSRGRLGTVASDPVTERIPIYFSQGDLVFPTEHFQPRMSQGMFRIALEAMYKTLTGLELERVVYGKPEHATYAYADELLASWVDDLYGAGAQLPENVYMIGDNPASDICGGNMYGWHTCLVRTGVFQGGEGENDGIHPASFGVFDDVLEAVTAAIRKELGLELRFEWNAPVNSQAQEKD
jgi:HAD superfamily hydrolase (TIGR01456 family)